nr:hypothetical protein [Chloroflexus sp.]
MILPAKPASNPPTSLATHQWEDGPHPIFEITHQDRRLAFFRPSVGTPIAAGFLEEAIELGCRKFIACGECGGLDQHAGGLIAVSAAVRAECVSYHYLPPSREVVADETGVKALVDTIRQRGLSYRLGKT